MLYSIDYLYDFSRAEFDVVMDKHGDLLEGADILEVGSGTGFQLMLGRIARRAVGVDLRSSLYNRTRVTVVVEYDGMNLPFKDGSFDFVDLTPKTGPDSKRVLWQKSGQRPKWKVASLVTLEGPAAVVSTTLNSY
jgi:SAM-dependent methyltransferase